MEESHLLAGIIIHTDQLTFNANFCQFSDCLLHAIHAERKMTQPTGFRSVQTLRSTKVPSLSVLVKIANTLSVSADELLLDCLEHSSSANSEFHRLLLDCNETEQTVIIRMAKELKATLVSLGI